MNDTVIARRYANALFAIGKKTGMSDLEQYGKNFTQLDSMLQASPDLDKVFKSPVVTADEKKRVLGSVLTAIGANTTMSNFCLLLADKNRLSNLRRIASCYSTLLDDEKGVIRGHLLTAVPLDNKKRGVIKKQLEAKAGKSLELTFDVDASILGGIVLKVGDRVMDASVRAQLDILREIIKRAGDNQEG